RYMENNDEVELSALGMGNFLLLPLNSCVLLLPCMAMCRFGLYFDGVINNIG
ncbi:Unknown protein, partial [Striga hermonthica]